ncbi:MAG: ATP-binding protein [Butyrivibrio sp.]|nr:ATP-binding protein [Butyrivibrio sp.]
MRADELILYKDFDEENEKLLSGMSFLMENGGKVKERYEADRKKFYDCMKILISFSGERGFYGNLWNCFLTYLLVSNENCYSTSAEIRGDISGSINDIALHDIEIFKEFFDFDFTELCEKLDVKEMKYFLEYEDTDSESKMFNKRIRNRICTLAKSLSLCSNAEDMKNTLTDFYMEYGVGKLGLHKAFRVKEENGNAIIDPIKNIKHVKMDDLVGYEIAKKKLIDNTEAFIEGRAANNCLLYGDAGTGKSSSIKAIANEYYSKGLRIIEIYKHQFKLLNDVIDQIKKRNYKFIIYMDDLSFEDFETEYKYLKAVIEGGLEKKPDNVLIYATSNRRHLIRESFKDKKRLEDDDIHRSDTVQEKLSLSNRFGVSIYFGAPNQDEYKEIVKELAKREGIDVSEEVLMQKAIQWEMVHGGLSGRTARQFVDYVLGTGIE